MCGEKSKKTGLSYGKLGSPPHVRGKASVVLVLVLVLGSPPHVRGKVVSL